MNAYNGQCIGAATVALGLAEGAYELGLAYSQEREQLEPIPVGSKSGHGHIYDMAKKNGLRKTRRRVRDDGWR